MAKAQDKRQQQKREARLEIVAELYKKGYSMREIRREVMARLHLPTYSLRTVQNDKVYLLNEWKENRLQQIDDAKALEEERINHNIKELWMQWEVSKRDYVDQRVRAEGTSDNNAKKKIVQEKREVRGLGNIAYIAEIRQQEQERRKLLGLYAPEKRDIQGGLSFETFLINSGLVEDETENEG